MLLRIYLILSLLLLPYLAHAEQFEVRGYYVGMSKTDAESKALNEKFEVVAIQIIGLQTP